MQIHQQTGFSLFDYRYEGNSLAQYAAFWGNEEFFNYVIKNEPRLLDQRNDYKENLLHHVVCGNSLSIFTNVFNLRPQFLREYMNDGYTPLMLLVGSREISANQLEMIKICCNYDINLLKLYNWKKGKYANSLWYALENGHLDLFKYFIDLIDLNDPDWLVTFQTIHKNIRKTNLFNQANDAIKNAFEKQLFQIDPALPSAKEKLHLLFENCKKYSPEFAYEIFCDYYEKNKMWDEAIELCISITKDIDRDIDMAMGHDVLPEELIEVYKSKLEEYRIKAQNAAASAAVTTPVALIAPPATIMTTATTTASTDISLTSVAASFYHATPTEEERRSLAAEAAEQRMNKPN